MKFRYWLILPIIVATLCLSACNETFIETTSETLSAGVYAIVDSLNAGRIDLANQYVISLEKLVPLPKNRIRITPVISNGIQYVILGDNLKGKTVVVVGSADFNNLVKIKAIAAQQQSSADAFAKQAAAQALKDQQATNALIVKNQFLQKEVDEWRNSIEYKIKTFLHDSWLVTIFGLPIIAIGLIVLCIFVPPAIPIVTEVLGSIFGIIWRIVSWFFSELLSLASWMTSNTKKTITTI